MAVFWLPLVWKRPPRDDGPVGEQAGLDFSGLLRRLRSGAGLTQEELAEAAGVSQRAVSDLERGINRTARKDTAVLLAGVLSLYGPARELFVAAARGRAPAGEALAAAARQAGAEGSAAGSRTLPRDIAAFTSRQDGHGQLMGGGAVTFLFTDIEGSTALLRRVGEGVYARLLADHHALVRSVLAAHGGRELNTLGDGFFAAFSSPRACVAAVVAMQQVLEGHAWPAGERLRVRMGVHTGEASDTAVGPVGLDVHRAARVAAVAHGGQVLVSETAAALVRDALPPGAALIDLGVHELKDLGRPERIFQVSAPGLQAEFPPLRTLFSPVAAAMRTLPRDVARFTGRRDELGRLMEQWAEAGDGGGVVPVHAIGGMAGIGKTTFAVHAAHQLAERFPDGQFFLPLHAHTPGQRPVDPADALASLLLAAGVGAQAIPAGLDARAGLWRDFLAGKKVLLVLDDATGHEQVGPLLPGTAGSLVLITSRQRLTALEDAAVVSLDTLTPDEAAEMLARLSGRAGLTADDAGVGEITALCGYLPLAIGMMGRQLAHHPAWTPAGLAADLAADRNRLELMHAENLSVAAAFGLSYQDLAGDQRRLFRRLGLHPGPDMDAYAAAALDDTSPGQARRSLTTLYDQHLLTEPSPGRYRMHDLLREHARALADADESANRVVAVGRLLDYYTGTALAASMHVATRMVTASPAPPCRPPRGAPPVSTPRQATAWLQAERANLHAVGVYAADVRPQQAIAISAAMAGFLDAQGHWDQAAALHRGAAVAARQIEDQASQARALNDLAAMQGQTGDYQAATASVNQALALYRELGDRAGQACALNNLGLFQHYTGKLPAAIASHRQALELFADLGHRYGQGDAHNNLGTIQMLTGDYPAAAASLRQAIALFSDLGHRLKQGDALYNLATAQRLTGDFPAATASQQQALELFGDLGDRYGQAHVLGEMGTVQRLTGDLQAATATQQQALKLFRDLGDQEDQAWVLNELGLVQQLAGDYPAAAASHQRALDLFREFGVQIGQAEALNNLGELLFRSSASQQARDHHLRALAIARDLGVPQEEARALEAISRCDVQDGNAAEGATRLREALAIYQRIGAPDAARVQEALSNLSV